MTDQFGVNSPEGRALFLETSRIVCHYCPASAQGLCESCALKKAVDGLRPLPKIEMRLIWHNCKTCPPEEECNERLYLWNGERVVQAEWCHNSWLYDDGLAFAVVKPEEAEHMWWADLDQTTGEFFKEETEQ